MRKMMTIWGACALLIALPGCGDHVPVASAGAAPAATEPIVKADTSQVAIAGFKTLTEGALIYDSVAKSATAAVQLGVIRGPNLLLLRELNEQATMALAFGYTAASAAERARAVGTLRAILSRIRALAP